MNVGGRKSDHSFIAARTATRAGQENNHASQLRKQNSAQAVELSFVVRGLAFDYGGIGAFTGFDLVQ